MADTQFKRNIAYKLRIEDITSGHPVIENERFSFLESGNKRISRVNVVASVVDKYDINGERKYVFLTIDDGSGQIKVKAFGDDSDKIRGINHGDTISIIGTLRYFNNELYISPEVVSEQDPRYLIVRKLELEKEKPKSFSSQTNQQETMGIRERIIMEIKESEKEGGIDTEMLNNKLGDIPKETINSEIQKLLEEGMAFEPRPGRVRWLG